MKNRRCAGCGGETLETAIAGPPAVLRCRGCRLLFLEEFPGEAERRGFYQGDYYDEASGERFCGPLERLVRPFRRRRARDILRRLPPRTLDAPDAFLDVGCGRGLLLDELQARGWRVTGTQLSAGALAACARRGITVLDGELPELALEAESYRAVAFYHVLEHLDRPLEYLEEAHRLLRPDGLLVLEVPDASSPGFRLLGARNFCLDYPHHLFFFTPESLRGLVRRAGFEVTAVRRFSLEYSPYTALQNLLNCLPGEPNRLYRALMRNREGARLRRSPLTWLHAALGLALAPAALALSLAALCLPVGNTLRLYCRKRQRGFPPPAHLPTGLCIPPAPE
jgi:SAM-dependent methyltransferase